MIHSALGELSRRVAHHLSSVRGYEDHQCRVIYTSLADARKEWTGGRSVSWLRPSQIRVIQANEGHRAHRNQLRGRYIEGSYEQMPFVTVRALLEWQISLPAAMESMDHLMAAIFGATSQSVLSFSILFRIGDQPFSAQVHVTGEEGDPGTINTPDLESDVTADLPVLIVPLMASNIPVLLAGSSRHKQIPAIEQIQFSVVEEGADQRVPLGSDDIGG